MRFQTHTSHKTKFSIGIIAIALTIFLGACTGKAVPETPVTPELQTVVLEDSSSVAESSSSSEVASSVDITITVGDTVMSAVLNDSAEAKEFQASLPITISMTRMGEHEYYGSLAKPLTHTDSLQIGYTVGDLAFWTPGDLFAVYFDEPDEVPEGLMILGKITSDLAVFDLMGNPAEMRIEAAS